MPPISRSRFNELLRELSTEEFVSLVADLWEARGWTTEIRGDTVIATRQEPTADRQVLLVRHAAPLFDRIEWSTDRTDATHVVTSGDGSGKAAEFARSLGADLVERDALYEMAVYALDVEVREAVFQRHFDRSATVRERSGLVAAAVARLRTRRGKLVALAVVLLLFAVTTGAMSLGDDRRTAPTTPGDDGTRVVTPSPEPFTVEGSELSVSTATPSTTPSATPSETPSATPNEASLTSTRDSLRIDGSPGTGADALRMFRGDPARTGYHRTTDGPRGDIVEVARFEDGFGFISSPAVVNGTIYLGHADGTFYALDARSLQVRWSRTVDSAIRSSPAVLGDDVILIGGMAGNTPSDDQDDSAHLHAIDPGNGEPYWRGSTGRIWISSPVSVNGTTYVGSIDERVYAVNTTFGTTSWERATNGSVYASPAVVGDTVYVGSTDGNVYALNASDGSIRWDIETNNSVVSTAAVANGTVYVGSTDGNVYALDARTGSVQWRNDTESAIVASPAVANGTVYVGRTDGTVAALDGGNGSVEWQAEISGEIVAAPVATNRTVYAATTAGTLYAFDRRTGDELWTYAVRAGVWSAPAVVDGIVYVTTDGGTVVALAERSRVTD